MAVDQVSAHAIPACSHCGQRLHRAWTRCPRCRLLLAEASASASEGAARALGGRLSRPSVPARVAALAAGAAVVGVVALLMGGFRQDEPAAAAPAAAPAVAGPTAPPERASPPADLVDSPGPRASAKSLDARRVGVAAYAQGDYASALSRFEDAVATSPHDPEAHNNLGQTLVRLGRADEALAHFDEAIRLDATRWSYRFNRARAYGLLNRWDEAVAEYRVAASLFPDDHATLYNLGLALMRVDDYAGAAQALEQAVALAPEETGFLITLGTAYIGAGAPDRARGVFEQFLARAPDDPEAARVRDLLRAMSEAGQ